MRSISRNDDSASGFTLIELLVVLTIIGILASIAFPVYNKILARGQKLKAQNDITQIVNAITTFRVEYGRFPVVAGAADPAAFKTDEDFMPILLAEEAAVVFNTRGIVFFEGVAKSGSGLHGLDEDGNFFDPWGEMYEIVIDGNYDNKITILGADTRGTVAVRSSGPDKVFQTGAAGETEDDVTSW